MNNNTYWQQVMALKPNDDRHKGICNTLKKDEVETILATFEYFGAADGVVGCISFDLWLAKYRIFDWLATCIDGRLTCEPSAIEGLKVITFSFLNVNGDITKMIKDLRLTDYDTSTMRNKWAQISFEK
jgi:hypothetical protein